MATTYTALEMLGAIGAASQALSSRKDEINRLNVFPVPDGDTGTNMALTIESVVKNLGQLTPASTPEDVRRAITTGALMGARGNSGVITSQILRGLCEGMGDAEELDVPTVAAALAKAEEVAFQAVRKPVEGTILTVLRDTAAAAHKARKKKMGLEEALELIVEAAYESVQRTPELLPVLKENGVVDAGGFGLAILFDSFVAALLGKAGTLGADFSFAGAEPKVEIEHVNDWEGSQYRYCNEFLVDSDTLDKEAALEFLATMGDCELCVGEVPKFKVHVHSDHPDQVLAYFLEQGQVSEVFIHNMQLQAEERSAKLAAEQADAAPKPLGFVAVAAGEGNAEILRSLGVDVVVSGGQTMNPSTKDLLDAAQQVNAEAVVLLPDNSNIIMAAQSACELAEKPCGVVPTRSVPEAFAALFAVDPEAPLEQNVVALTEALADVRTGEVTTAIRDSKDAHDNPIAAGDVIGIAQGSIEVVAHSVDEAVMGLLAAMDADDADTCTLLAGEDMAEDDFEALVEAVEAAYEDLDVDAHRGGQPLYPVILSLE